MYTSDQNRSKASAMFYKSRLKSDPLTFKNNLTLAMRFSKRKEWTLPQNKRKVSCYQLFRNKNWRKYENVNKTEIFACTILTSLETVSSVSENFFFPHKKTFLVYLASRPNKFEKQRKCLIRSKVHSVVFYHWPVQIL